MKLIIQLDQRDPPSGTIRLSEELPQNTAADATFVFAGWLNLVGKLYEALGIRQDR